nr:PREDICTED: ras-related protein Rab-36 isoform X3 [Rhinolophus sinicus]
MVTALLPAVEHFPLQAPPRPRPRRPGFVRCPPVPRGARCHGDPCCSPCQTRPRGTPNLRSRCGLSGMMKSSLTPLGPPVSRDRIIATFPKWYTPAACLQLKEHFHGQVNAACQRRNTGTVGLNLSKVVVVGDLYVGKTSLIHRFCKNVFDRDYKATIGVDFEIERFEIAGIPYSLQMGECEGLLPPRGCPGVRAVSAAGPGEEGQQPVAARHWRPHPNGGRSTRDPGEQETLQLGLLLAGDCLRGLRTPHTHGQCLL